MGIFMFSGPVFADPDPNTPDPNVSQDVQVEQADGEQPSCYDEVGGIGWLVCPGTSFLANVIDGAYNIIDQLIKVDPLPSDTKSPIYVVWSYIKAITNLVFVIFLFIVIYSQLTGYGINNYGIKRILPRLIVAAIAVNLSFIICTLAVDVSNIVGGSLLGFFEGVLNDALANSQISNVATSTSVSSIVGTILGVGAAGATVALAFTGGLTGLLWALIPIILSGAISVISAVITMAARQALIILLAIISPLAIVCCLLPNTEKWFQRWKQLFVSMLFFYPMFSFLYGVSRLAGLIVITSADSWLLVILGIAIEVLPLFFSLPLLRMSGTMLGRIDDLVRRGTFPAMRMATVSAAERQALARQNQLGGIGRFAQLPHNRLARYLEQRRMNRVIDLRESSISNEDRYRTRAMGREYFRGNGTLRRRGVDHYEREKMRMENQKDQTHYMAVFDRGFAADGTDNHVSVTQRRRINRINNEFTEAIAGDSIANAFANSVRFENMESRARIIQDGMADRNSQIYNQVLRTFNANDTQSRRKAVSAVLSDAITAKAHVDKEAKDIYNTYFNSIEPGNELTEILSDAIDSKDYNAMVPALQNILLRGDHDKIGAILRAKSASLYGDTAADKIMQKELRDTLVRYKVDDADIWSWAKANMMRAAMHSSGKDIASYIDFAAFMSGNTVAGDTDQSAINKVNSDTIIQGAKEALIVASQDRTVFNDLLDMQRQGVITKDTNDKLSLKFSIKQIRSAITSGQMEGDQLEALNNLLTGGVNKYGVNDAWIQENKTAIIANLRDFLSGLSPSQLAAIKTATIVSINDALLKLAPSDRRMLNHNEISGILADAVEAQSAALCRSNAVTDRNRMNAQVRDMLGIREIDPRGRTTNLQGGTQDAVRI